MRTILLLIFIYLVVRVVMSLIREGKGQQQVFTKGFRFYRYSTPGPRQSGSRTNKPRNLDSIEEADFEELDDDEKSS